MEDKREEALIPLGCAVNIAIIGKLSKTDAFTKACVETPLEYGITPPKENEPWPFFNISWGAYMMYCVFVVSKEIYNLPNEDEYFQELVAKNAMKDFSILKEKHSFKDNPKYHFNCLRNAISHVHYKVGNDKIKLWDHPPRKEEPKDWHWEVEIYNEKFRAFMGLVNDENITLYNEIKSGVRNEKGIK